MLLVGKNKIEILTGDEQSGMSHGPVQIILTNHVCGRLLERHLTDNGEMLFIFLFVMYINIYIQALVEICNS